MSMIAFNEIKTLKAFFVAPSGGDFFPLKASILFFYFQFKHATKQNG